MTSFSLLIVTTHAFHLMSLWSNHLHHSKSLIAPSDMLHFIFGTSFLHHSEFLIQIIHLTLSDLHLNMRFVLLHNAKLRPENLPFSENFTLYLSTIVSYCLSYWSHGLRPFSVCFGHRLLCLSSMYFCLSYSYVKQTNLASSLVRVWAHSKIAVDWLIDWLASFALEKRCSIWESSNHYGK